MTSHPHPYLAIDAPVRPPPVESGGLYCWEFDRKWVPYIASLLKTLLVRRTYTSDQERAVGEAHNLVASLIVGGNCGGSIMNIRAKPGFPCILQKTVDGEIWEDFADLSTCGAQGEQGEQGIQGIQGIQGEQGIQGVQGIQVEQGIQGEEGEQGVSGSTSNPAPNPPGEDGPAKRCGVARGVSQWAIDKFSDSLDFLTAAFEAAQAVETAISGLIDAIPVVGAFIDAAMDFGAEVVEWDIVNLKTCITEEFEDDVFCELYCRLGDDGLITDQIFSDWTTAVAGFAPCITGLTLVGQVMALNMLAIGAQNMRNRGYIFAAVDSGCPPCDDCPDVVIELTEEFGGTLSKTEVLYNETFTLTMGADSGAYWNYQGGFSLSLCAKVIVVGVTGWNPGGGGALANWTNWDCADVPTNTNGAYSFPSSGTSKGGGNSLDQAVFTLKLQPL